jgi:hypothetical protein
MSVRRSWLLAGVILASLTAAGCQPANTETAGSGREDRPARVIPVEGTGLSRVILTPRAAERIGLMTEPVRLVAAAAGPPNLGVPLAALVYDKTGGTWVYAATQALSFERQRVSVVRVDGDLAVLQAGPAPGTAVATVGAAELLGAEYGVEGQ